MIFAGDFHNIKAATEAIIKAGLENDDILQVGDFGVGFNFDDIKRLNDFNDFLVEKNLRLWAFRGNHDDKRYFMGKYSDKSPATSFFSNLYLIPDYTILEIQGHRILCIGGAISIDRMRMLRLMAEEKAAGTLPIYFESEKFVLDVEFLKEVREIDILATHSAPSYCLPYVKSNVYDETDLTLVNDLDIERKQHTIMMNILLENNKIERHFYGHFHKSYRSEDRGVVHTCLDICDFKEVL